jgi:CDP-diacylglycerol--serine O-phosphatidyltransferase
MSNHHKRALVRALVIVSVLMAMAVTAWYHGTLNGGVLVLLLGRELVIAFQRVRAHRRGRHLYAGWMGRLKTNIQFFVLTLLLLRIPHVPLPPVVAVLVRGIPEPLVLWGVLVMVFGSVVSLFPYFHPFWYVNAYRESQRDECRMPWYIVTIPNVFTIGNYLCGITAVYFAMPQLEVPHRPFVVLFWILFASLFDALDGPVARKLNAHSEFGACLDSSTDLSTFGLASALVIYLGLPVHGPATGALAMFVSLFYFVCVHLRLARFTRIQDALDEHGTKPDFVGLPSPSGAVGAMVFFACFSDVRARMVFVLLLSLLMVSDFNYISHANSFGVRLYRCFLIPWTFFSFVFLGLLTVIASVFHLHAAPFTTALFQCLGWAIMLTFSFYILHGLQRGRVQAGALLVQEEPEDRPAAVT